MAGYTYGAAQALTVTNLHSLASSATAGWQSAAITLTDEAAVDVLVQAVFDFANTAPANDRCVYLFVASALASTYANPATGSEGTITLPDVTANPSCLRPLGRVPYVTQDEVAESSVFSVAAAFGGVCPKSFSVIAINFSGAALAASGNSVSYQLISVS